MKYTNRFIPFNPVNVCLEYETTLDLCTNIFSRGKKETKVAQKETEINTNLVIKKKIPWKMINIKAYIDLKMYR